LVGLFNKKKKKMSWQIPTQVEQDIIAGKATYRTFQTGNGGQSILPVPANAYVVIFGYDFSPAGGGFIGGFNGQSSNLSGVLARETTGFFSAFETQQIAFYTGTDFYPFIHHVNMITHLVNATWDETDPANSFSKTVQQWVEVDNTPIARQVYITSSNDVSITHGLVRNATRVTTGPIPVTSRTPSGLTYGGSGQNVQAQTDYGPAVTPLQFMQPSTKDFQDFGLGLLPANADGQAFATPDVNNGLIEAQNFINTIVPGGGNIISDATSQYYLCLHYALYSKTIPETRG